MMRGRLSGGRFVERVRCGVLLSFLMGHVLLGFSISVGGRASANSSAPDRAGETEWRRFREYIRQSWRILQRTPRDLVRAAEDPKFPSSTGRWIVYISPREDRTALEARLRQHLSPDEWARIELRRLPDDPAAIREHGLLYLPHPYVVPGGRFNEMYGWDSYFIVLGLLREGEQELARSMVENFLYEIEHYGKILNANRTYYLTRSQPPFLTPMILEVYARTRDKAWLARTVPAIEAFYRYWTEPPHLVPETGLSRYYDSGRGPAPEVLAHERDEQGRTHYDRVREYYRTHRVPDYDVRLFYDAEADRLTDLFYIADRSMRESGFDPSSRFGPFNAGVLSYTPVCLNSLLYVMERDMARILRELERHREAHLWERRARLRRVRINRWLWDERAGLYFDYNFVTRRRRPYPFVTTFFPLWAGIATRRQAARVVAHLSLFERPGGLQTSTRVTGQQWDAPYGWAPMHLIAVTGLRRYGYHAAAHRIAVNFISLVFKEFLEHGAIFEKYDVVRRESDVAAGLRFGYTANEIGFGWTNAVVLELLAELPESERPKVRRLGGVGVGR
jgi:alpha,alpha-trehalase